MISDKNSTILKIWDQLDATEQKDMVVELIDDIDDLCVAADAALDGLEGVVPYLMYEDDDLDPIDTQIAELLRKTLRGK